MGEDMASEEPEFLRWYRNYVKYSTLVYLLVLAGYGLVKLYYWLASRRK